VQLAQVEVQLVYRLRRDDVVHQQC
jgi:hypothetical protein